ncbi:MAG TPA: amino acid permease [Phycisphaerae bacterium]|nr:amino acid permease [Phycisphaerae bacterium]
MPHPALPPDVHTPGGLRRILGPISIIAVGVGGAIGSGIFAAPGEVARTLHSPWTILAVWLLAGAITLLQTLVTAELATRLPRAGGEYQYLRAAYGEFAAFFFGWSFTVFIVGGGAGTIAALFGDFAAELLGMKGRWASPVLGCTAIAAVAIVNASGLRTGAVTQNILTTLKALALVAIAVGACIVAGRATPMAPSPMPDGQSVSLEPFLLALMPAFWSYTGATDSAKLAEEVKDVRRALPRALCGSALLLTAIYLLYNYALLCAVAPQQMAGVRSVPAVVYAGHPLISRLILLASALICLGAISAVLLANVRVTYALARDGLTFAALGRMSRHQAPVAAIAVGAALAATFVWYRSFEQILRIYFLASTVLFGMTYLSLIVFRLRDRRMGREFPANVYQTPLGIPVALFLIAIEILIGVSIIHSDWEKDGRDSLWTLAFLAAMAVLYAVWKKYYRPVLS